jgi:diguanylate cyclase (GGDEF)-like protein
MPLRVLHISDLHERAAFDGMPVTRQATLDWDVRERGSVLGEKFHEALREATGGSVDLVCLTGDVADWGHPNEYEAATVWLRMLLNTVGIKPRRLFVVPGNHDVQRTVHTQAWRGIRKWYAQTRNGTALGRWLASVGSVPLGIKDKWRAQISERTRAFWQWAHSFGCAQIRSEFMPLGYRYTFSADTWPDVDVPVHVIGLDSAWLCGSDDDQGRIVVTEEQVQAHVLDRQGGRLDGFRIALVHHPLDHLADHQTVWAQLADGGVDLLLHGHQHTPGALVTAVPGASLRTLASGCLMDGDVGKNWPNGFQLVEIDVPSKAFTVHFRKWASDAVPRFWAKGSDIYRTAADGTLHWPWRDSPAEFKPETNQVAAIANSDFQRDLDRFERNVPQCFGGFIFIDVNGFKAINREYGEHVGDVVLREIEWIVDEVLRSIAPSDATMALYRFRADEFWVPLPPNVVPEHAEDYAAKVSHVVSAYNWSNICERMWVTVACGIAVRFPDEKPALCLLRAMIGTRRAKQSGIPSFGPQYLGVLDQERLRWHIRKHSS